MTDVPYADDVVLFVVGQAVDVARGAAAVAAMAVDVFTPAGLVPSFGPGKSEGVLLLRSRGSKKAKVDAFVAGGAVVASRAFGNDAAADCAHWGVPTHRL